MGTTFPRCRIPERRPSPDPDPPQSEVYTGRWFSDARQLAEFRANRALLIHGTKVSLAPEARHTSLIAIRIDPRCSRAFAVSARRRQKPYQDHDHELLERAARPRL